MPRPGAPMNGWRTPTKRSSAPMNSSRSMSEQLAKMERDDPAPSCGRTCPAIAARASGRAAAHAGITCASTPTARIASKAGAPEPHGFAAGGVLRCHCPGLVGLWRRAACRPLGAAARFNADHRRRKVQRLPRSPRHPSFKWPRPRQHHRTGSTHRQRHRKQHPWPRLRPRRKMRTAAGRHRSRRAPDQTQLLQTIARDLANLERTIEQLKANQQQMANDNSKAIGELKASQEEMKRALAKVSEPTPPKRHSLRHRLRRSRLRPCASPSGRSAAAGENAASILPEGSGSTTTW